MKTCIRYIFTRICTYEIKTVLEKKNCLCLYSLCLKVLKNWILELNKELILILIKNKKYLINLLRPI